MPADFISSPKKQNNNLTSQHIKSRKKPKTMNFIIL